MNTRKKMKYKSDLPRQLYSFFLAYQDNGIPTFDKFARSIGTTYEELIGFRSKKEFDRAWRECIEIKRDYLIDGALTRRFDPSFTKFLLTEEREADENSEEGGLQVTVTVVD